MDEHTPRHTAAVESSTDRAFGLVFTVVFSLIAFFPLINGQAIRYWALLIAAAFLMAALIFPKILSPLNRIWTKFGMLLHHIVNPIVLGILFFAVITPIALLMRARGKDLLRMRLDKAANSYWIEREPAGPDAESLNKQF